MLLLSNLLKKVACRCAWEEETLVFSSRIRRTRVAFLDGAGIGKLFQWTKIYIHPELEPGKRTIERLL